MPWYCPICRGQHEVAAAVTCPDEIAKLRTQVESLRADKTSEYLQERLDAALLQVRDLLDAAYAYTTSGSDGDKHALMALVQKGISEGPDIERPKCESLREMAERHGMKIAESREPSPELEPGPYPEEGGIEKRVDPAPKPYYRQGDDVSDDAMMG